MNLYNLKINIIVQLLLLLLPVSAGAQVNMVSSLDTTKMRIGEQVALKVTVEAPRNSHITFPAYKPQQEMVAGIEVLKMDNDTVDGVMCKVSRTYTLTSFDENDYKLPILTVDVDGKKFQTTAFKLHVETVETDTTENAAVRPPHDVQNNPFDWHEWVLPVILILLGILFIALVVWLAIRLRHNKPIRLKKRIIRRLLPHEKAMLAIEELKAQEDNFARNAQQGKLSENNSSVNQEGTKADMVSSDETDHEKLYYSRLTEVLRQYLNERFGINAMEMTSSQILDELQTVVDDPEIDKQELKNELREVLQTADLVKFAKYSTRDNEKDFYREHVVKFINDTKQPELPTTETIEPELTDSDRQNLRSRKITTVAIAIVVILALVCLSWAGWQLFELLK